MRLYPRRPMWYFTCDCPGNGEEQYVRMRSLPAVIILFSSTLAGRGDLVAPEPTGVQFLSGFSGGGHLLYFLDHQNELQEDRFVSEGLMEMDFSLASRADGFDLRLRFEMAANMGQSIAENLPFSPKEVAYEINPFVEYRRARACSTAPGSSTPAST